MNEVLFNTQAESNAQQESDYNKFKSDSVCNHGLDENGNVIPVVDCPKCAAYWKKTTKWDTPRLRNDGKYATYCYSGSDYTGKTVEAFNESKYL